MNNPFANVASVNPFMVNTAAATTSNSSSEKKDSKIWFNLVTADFQHLNASEDDYASALLLGTPLDNISQRAFERAGSVNSSNELYKNLSSINVKNAKGLEDAATAVPKGKGNIKYVLCELVNTEDGEPKLLPTNLAIQLVHKGDGKSVVDPEKATEAGYGAPCPFGMVGR